MPERFRSHQLKIALGESCPGGFFASLVKHIYIEWTLHFRALDSPQGWAGCLEYSELF